VLLIVALTGDWLDDPNDASQRSPSSWPLSRRGDDRDESCARHDVDMMVRMDDFAADAAIQSDPDRLIQVVANLLSTR
jgi:hypothetical protein